MANLKCIGLAGTFVLVLLLLIFYWNKILHLAFQGAVNNLPKIKSSPAEWDDIPITHFHVRTSHNSFTGANMQVFSEASPKAVLHALNLGARAIEIDVGLDKNGKCVVGHKGLKPGRFTTTTASFEDILQLIADNAFKEVNDTLFLCIDNSSDPKNALLGQQIHKALTTILGKYLETEKRELHRVYLKELRNKIVLLGSIDENDYDPLRKITHSFTNRGSLDEKALAMQSSDAMTRVWPQHWTSVFSINFNAIPFMRKNNRMIAMNFGQYDPNLLTYLKQFGEYGLKPVAPALLNYQYT